MDRHRDQDLGDFLAAEANVQSAFDMPLLLRLRCAQCGQRGDGGAGSGIDVAEGKLEQKVSKIRRNASTAITR